MGALFHDCCNCFVTGSSEHDLVGARTFNFLTDTSSRSSNPLSEIEHCEDTEVELPRNLGVFLSLSLSKSLQMSVIFLTKNDPISLASLDLSQQGVEDIVTCLTEKISFNRQQFFLIIRIFID